MTAITLDIPSNGIQNSTDQSISKQAVQSWVGYGVTTVKDSVTGVANGILGVARGVVTASQKCLSALAVTVTDAPMVAGIFRKFDHHILRFIEEMRNTPGSLAQFQSYIKHNVAFIDFVQLIADIDYLGMGRFKEKINENGEVVKQRDHALVIAGKASFFAADIGGAILWLREMGFCSLSNAAATIGEVQLFKAVPQAVASIPVISDLPQVKDVTKMVGELRVFSFVKNLSCHFITLRALDLAYACFALNAGRRFYVAENNHQRISAGLDFSSYLSELILSGSLLAGATSVVGLGVGASACVLLAVTSFLFRVTYANEIKQTVQMESIK